MNIDVDYKLQQKIALLTAADVPENLIAEKTDTKIKVVRELQEDADFKNLVTTLKNDLDRNKPMLVLKDDDKALEIWVKDNMYNLLQSADNFEKHIYELLDNKDLKGIGDTKGLRDLSSAITQIMEVKRKILSDMDTNILKNRDMDIKENKYTGRSSELSPLDVVVDEV